MALFLRRKLPSSAWGPIRLRCRTVRIDECVTPCGQREILCSDPALIVGRQFQGHLIVPNINVRMMAGALSFLGDPSNKIDALGKPFKLKGSQDGPRAPGPFRHRSHEDGDFRWV